MSGPPGGEPDPDALLEALRRSGEAPPLPPLRLADAPPSARGGPAGPAVGAARRAVLRLLTPVLGDLLSQLERDRHRTRAELARARGAGGPARARRGAGRTGVAVRLAFVVQRYGAEVAGGAEALCRQTARALAAAGEDVVVYTTTARDYLTWAPHYPAGAGVEDGVRVLRFPVREPDPAVSAAALRALSLAPGDAALERRWAMAQGPVAPALLGALERAAGRYEAVALWTYLYATSQMAAPLVADRVGAGPAGPRRADAAVRAHPGGRGLGGGAGLPDPGGAAAGGRPARHRSPALGRRGRRPRPCAGR